MASSSFRAILRTLIDHEVRFILVGAVSAVLQGAALNTFDVDIVHSTDPDNIDRLIILGHVGRHRAYADLTGHAISMEIGGSLKISVLDLETLIAVKEEVGGEKDLAVLPILRSVLKVRSKRDAI